MPALERFHERLGIVVVARGDEVEHSTPGAEDKAQFEAGATLEVVALQTANSQAGMQVRCAKAVTDSVDYVRELVTAWLWELADSRSKPLRMSASRLPL